MQEKAPVGYSEDPLQQRTESSHWLEGIDVENPSERNASAAPAIDSVLIVDDDPFSKDWLSELLAGLGVPHIHTASNGRDALKKLRQLEKLPDVLICDIFMPDMDGIEFLEQIVKRRYAGRFMLISGQDMETLTLARELADAGLMNFVGAFVKPVSRDTLAYALKLG